MIQANELRVGNLLNYHTAEGDVVTLTTDYHAIQWATEDPKGFNLVHSPIPLTEERLVKLGGIDTNYEITIKCGGEKIVFKWSSRVIATNVRNGWGCNKYKHIKYLHQLQNLYFSLRGQELTITH